MACAETSSSAQIRIRTFALRTVWYEYQHGETGRASVDLTDGNRAWLTLSSADDYRRIIGSGKYDDNPASHYSWDDTVPNHANLRTGDVVVLWDKKTLIGASVIEQIETGKAIKPGFGARAAAARTLSRARR